MKIIVSDKTRETINKEYTRFMSDPNNLARLKMKLTLNQRVFIDTLQETYNNQSVEAKSDDKLLLLQQAILTFNARPELVPNAPIDLLRQKVTFKGSPDDFEQLIVFIKVWKNSLKRSKRPINRLGVFFAKRNKILLYPFFVAVLTATITAILNEATDLWVFSRVDFRSLAFVIVAGFVSIAAGKGIFFRIVAENEIE